MEIMNGFSAFFFHSDVFRETVVVEHPQEIFAADGGVGAVQCFRCSRHDIFVRRPFDVGRVILIWRNIAESGFAGRFFFHSRHTSEDADKHPSGDGLLR